MTEPPWTEEELRQLLRFEITYSKVVTIVLAILVGYLLAGCSTVREMSPQEKLWQALHAVDSAQTLQIARHPDCYREIGWGTQELIGEHPSEVNVVAWAIGSAAAHAWVSSWLEDHHAPKWAQWTWHTLTIARSADYVKNNFEQGLSPTGAHC